MSLGRGILIRWDEVEYLEFIEAEVSMDKTAKPIEKKGGYPAGDKLVSELAPPPKGPGAGAKPSDGSKPGL